MRRVRSRVQLFLDRVEALALLALRELLAAHEHARADDLAGTPGGHAQRRVLDVLGLLAEDDLQQALLGGELLLALRSDLADEDVALADDGRGDDDARLVERLKSLGADVRDVARDLFGSELGVASLDLELGDVDGGERRRPSRAARRAGSRPRSCTLPTA